MEKQDAQPEVNDPRVSFLKKISFFATFDDHELKQLLGVSRWLKVPSGTLIIKEGSTDRVLYILVRGAVQVFKTIKKGKRLELTTLTTGATFGEMAMVAETKRTAGVETLSDTYILMVEPEILHHANVFLQLKFYKRFCSIMVERLVDANHKIAGEPVVVSTVPKPVAPPKPIVKKVEKAPVVKKQSSRVNLTDLPAMPEEKSVARTRMQRRVHGQLDLPVNPAVASQLSSFLIGDCEDTRKFSDLICLDPILASKVLQVANSSFYRRSTEVSSVAHALVTVGIKNIQELIAEETMRIIGDTDYFGGFYELARSFWRHSVVVGRITELLKDVMSVNVYEDVYLAGLLHDLGVLSLDVQGPDFYPQLLRPDFLKQGAICDLERQYIGGDHCQAGAYLFEKLGLPKSFLDAAQFHHTPEKAKDHLLMVGLVTLADLFAIQRGVCIGAPHETAEVSIDESFAWVLIRESHPPFVDVDVNGFIYDFNCELDRSWANITGDIPL